MEKLTLLEALKSNSMTLTLGEIEAIMDEELAKSPEEMDAELIDLCAQTLEKAYLGEEEKAEEKPTSKKRIKLTRALLIAAIITIIFSIAIPVSAKYVHIEASDKIVQFFKDHFKINLSGSAETHSDEGIDLVKALQEGGFESIILPSAILSDEWKKSDIAVGDDAAGEEELDLYLSGYSNLSYNDIFGYVAITYHKTEFSLGILGKSDMGPQYDVAKQLNINGMDVAVFYSTQSNYVTICYVDERTDYSIHLESCDLQTAVEIAKTLE